MIGFGVFLLYVIAALSVWPLLFRWFINDITPSDRPDVEEVLGSAVFAFIACFFWPLIVLYRFVLKPITRWWIEIEYPETPVEDSERYNKRNR